MVTEHFVYVCNSRERSITLGILYGYKGVMQVKVLPVTQLFTSYI